MNHEKTNKIIYSGKFRFEKTEEFIQPPIPGAEMPYLTYRVSAKSGGVINYPTGSVIIIPANAFVNNNGQRVNDSVDVQYREFHNPLEIFLSGIPMNYDSAGKSYTFESSGLCEVLAYKDGVPVFVNPKSKPEINLVSDNNSQTHNLYYCLLYTSPSPRD